MASSVRPNEPFVKIPFPRPSQNVNRGFRIETPKMRPRCIRITDDDYEFITKVALKNGMSFGEFVRWASYYTALETSNAQALEGFKERDVRSMSKSLKDQGFK